jgi:hypothetical protein
LALQIHGDMLAGWPGVTRLCLWTNQLTALPPEVGRMQNLQVRKILLHLPREMLLGPTERLPSMLWQLCRYEELQKCTLGACLPFGSCSTTFCHGDFS